MGTKFRFRDEKTPVLEALMVHVAILNRLRPSFKDSVNTNKMETTDKAGFVHMTLEEQAQVPI